MYSNTPCLCNLVSTPYMHRIQEPVHVYVITSTSTCMRGNAWDVLIHVYSLYCMDTPFLYTQKLPYKLYSLSLEINVIT